jgi:glycosyltransferase involved in cell wall biosynthesis
LINLKYISACKDFSGYGRAARGNIVCLLNYKKLINLSLKAVSFEIQKTNVSFEEDITPYIDKPITPSIQIIHLTPDNFPQFVNSKTYNIGYCVWEADKLPESWKKIIQCVDEIWTASDYNVEIFRNAGFSKPILKVPHYVPIPDVEGIKPLKVGGDNTFVFYSIFQWLARKNGEGILKAYLSEFQNGEDVCLGLKTYRLNTSSPEQEIVKNQIKAIKQSLNLTNHPPISFFGGLMSAEEIKGFHLRGDCFVLPSRSEAFSQGPAEAMALGKPTISTRYSGMLEFMNDENSFLVDYVLTPISGMLFSHYNGTMTWAHPSIDDIKKKMRWIYENREEAKKIGEKGRETIKQKLNKEVIGKIMTDRLVQISKEKGIA